MPTIKRCPRCGEAKRLDDFHRKTKSADGRQPYCRACNSAQDARWQRANPERVRAKGGRRRARVRGATPEDFTPAELFALWAEADAWACVFCGAPWEHIEHFVPLSRGGDHALGNLWPACADCNLAKSNRDPWEFLRSRGVPHV